MHILRGLETLHQHQIIHRNIKPSNILLKDKTAIISDLGLALTIKEKKSKIPRSDANEFSAPELFEDK